MCSQTTDGYRFRLVPSCRVAARGGLAALVLIGASLVGCGSSSKVEARTTTVGQELQDLDQARNKGLLTEDEYAAKRAEILKSG